MSPAKSAVARADAPPRTALVTGATGFLGHHVVAACVAAGWTTIALCRDPDARAATRLDARARRVRGDVTDPDQVGSAALGADVVFHCAGMVSRKPEDAEAMHRANVDGTRVVVEAAKKAGVSRMIHASTSGTVAISTDPDHIANETDETPIELINRWPYYRSKLYAERLALAASGEGFSVVSVNPSLLLGPGDLHGSSTEDVRRFLETGATVVPDGGVSFVDARDVAAAMFAAIERGRPGERYLLTACNCSTRTFLARVARVAGVEPPVATLPRRPEIKRLTSWLTREAGRWLGQDDARPDEHSVDVAQHYWYCDSSKAERELGFAPRDPMRTLADTVEDLRERGLIMGRRPSDEARP